MFLLCTFTSDSTAECPAVMPYIYTLFACLSQIGIYCAEKQLVT